jgi:hypothetical protein
MCPNLHANIHELLDEIEKSAIVGSELTPNAVIAGMSKNWRTSFPSVARVIAYRGWQLYGGEFLVGRWTQSYHRYKTDGTPREDGVPPYGTVMGFKQRRKGLLNLL